MAHFTAASEGVTTIMMRNLPRKYTSWDLVYELERFTTRASFDFVYVPWDRSSVTNMSYAFVNFVDSGVAMCITRHMDGRAWAGSPGRVARIRPAHVQGLAVNLERFQMQVASKGAIVDEHAPLVFEQAASIPWDVALERQAAVRGHAARAARASQLGSAAIPPGHKRLGGTTFEERPPRVSLASQSALRRGLSPEDSEDSAEGSTCLTEGSASSSGSLLNSGSDSRTRRAAARVSFAQVAMMGVGNGVDHSGVAQPRPCLTAAQVEGLAASKLQVRELLVHLLRATRSSARIGGRSNT